MVYRNIRLDQFGRSITQHARSSILGSSSVHCKEINKPVFLCYVCVFYLFYIVQYKDFTLSNNCYYPKIYHATNSAIYLGHFFKYYISPFPNNSPHIDNPTILIRNQSKDNNFESRTIGSTLRSKDRYLCNALPKSQTEVLPCAVDHDELAAHQ